jgi:hypothetical protein
MVYTKQAVKAALYKAATEILLWLQVRPQETYL